MPDTNGTLLDAYSADCDRWFLRARVFHPSLDGASAAHRSPQAHFQYKVYRFHMHQYYKFLALHPYHDKHRLQCNMGLTS